MTGSAGPDPDVALVGIAMPRREVNPPVVTVHAVAPQITRGHATVDVVVCHTGSGEDRIGVARGRVEWYCKSDEGPEGAKLGRDDELILRVRSQQPGDVVVHGLKVSYSHGWRRGSQMTGSTVKVRFGTESVGEHLDAG